LKLELMENSGQMPILHQKWGGRLQGVIVWQGSGLRHGNGYLLAACRMGGSADTALGFIILILDELP
jgi:hypothetical protein